MTLTKNTEILRAEVAAHIAADDGAEVIYSGCDMGWLQDASGAMDYMAAG